MQLAQKLLSHNIVPYLSLSWRDTISVSEASQEPWTASIVCNLRTTGTSSKGLHCAVLQWLRFLQSHESDRLVSFQKFLLKVPVEVGGEGLKKMDLHKGHQNFEDKFTLYLCPSSTLQHRMPFPGHTLAQVFSLQNSPFLSLLPCTTRLPPATSTLQKPQSDFHCSHETDTDSCTEELEALSDFISSTFLSHSLPPHPPFNFPYLNSVKPP